jgi:hypothetical protein
MRERKNNMIMTDRQQFFSLLHQPFSPHTPGTPRTTTMSAAIIKDTLNVAFRAPLHMTAESRSMTIYEHPNRFEHMFWEKECLLVCREIGS